MHSLGKKIDTDFLNYQKMFWIMIDMVVFLWYVESVLNVA